VRVVTRVITDLCVLDITSSGFEVVELAPDVTPDLIERQTGAPISFGEMVR
jgi:3-oxoacid CoA-transferase subunit B